MDKMAVKQLGYALGAQVSGIDLRQPLNDLDKRAIQEAWRRHLVLVFPNQDLTPGQLIAFSRNFGELDSNDATPYYRDSEHPEILLVTNKFQNGKPSETRNTGRNWHSDLTYTRHPAKGSLLLCKEKPPVGGDTLFANMYLAYETLSRKMRDFVDTLDAIHDASLIKGIEQRDPEKVADLKRRNPPVAHPVVRTHPETGRRALLVSERIRGFVGMTEEESAPILVFLNQHATSLEFTWRHSWSVNDLVMWDNRCLLHIALPDFDQTQPRHMIRCSLLGEESGYYVKDAAADKESLTRAVASVS